MAWMARPTRRSDGMAPDAFLDREEHQETRFPSFSWPSRLCSHEGEVVGEELSGHSIDKASKVACLGRLGGEHLREFADGGFHGASDPHQAGERVGIADRKSVV